jgi:hypothetical protein
VIDGLTGDQKVLAGPVGVGGMDWQVGGQDLSMFDM